MKMCMLVYAEATDDSIIAALKKAGITGYTKMVEARGEGTQNEPRLGTHIWPGRNNVIFFALPNENLDRVRDDLRRLETENPHAGIRCFVMPLEESL